MILKNKNGRKIECEVNAIGCFEDIYIESAYFIDSGKELTDQQLSFLEMNNQDALFEEWNEAQIERADNYMDMMKEV